MHAMLCLLCASLEALLCVRYVRRQAREKFRENAAITETGAIAEQWSKARENLALVQRQATVYTLFARKNKSIMVSVTSGNHMVENDSCCASYLPLGHAILSLSASIWVHGHVSVASACNLVFPHLHQPPVHQESGRSAFVRNGADNNQLCGWVVCRICRCSRC